MRRAMLIATGLLVGAAALAADPPRTVHGSSDAFAVPGVVLAWGVVRGASEAATSVVVRIESDPAVYPLVAITGVDPFTQARQPLLPVTRVARTLDFRSPRARFADYPRSELRFYASDAAAAADAPALVVYYLGVPDTTPEFADESRLDLYLAARLVRARNEPAGKAP